MFEGLSLLIIFGPGTKCYLLHHIPTQTNDQLIINGTTGPAGKCYAQVNLNFIHM